MQTLASPGRNRAPAARCCSAAEVPAEELPQQHAPLQPPTPEPLQQGEEPAANVEQEAARQLDYQPAADVQAARLQQQGGLPYWQRQGQGLRAPRAGVQRQQPGGGVQFAGLDFDDDEAPGRQPAVHRRQHAGDGGGPGGRGGGAGGSVGGGSGRPSRVARPRGEGTGGSKRPKQRRVAGAGGGGGSRRGGSERMYRGGAREDELPVGDVELGSGGAGERAT